MQSDFMKALLSFTQKATKDAGHAASADYLEANGEAYAWLVDRVKQMDSRRHPEALLNRVSFAAQFAQAFHSGRFADGAIENVAFSIGAELDELSASNSEFKPPAISKGNRRRVLHVASQVREIGGHSRMIYHWMRSDDSSSHSLAVIDQRDLPIPRWLPEAVGNSGGHLLVFPVGASLRDKALWLRETAKRCADLVVVHHNGSDVVPTVAFAVRECPPVAILNHADHTFWLGSSVSDIVINLRTAGSRHTEERRFVAANAVLPIPLADPIERPTRRVARRALGIEEDQVVLLSVARAEKFRPYGAYDFIQTVGEILERHPRAHLYVIGESRAGIAPYLRANPHERAHFLGSIEDPAHYFASADIFLETFPFGTSTALLEAALSALPVVPAYAPLFPLLVANDDAILDLIPNPESEAQYVELAEMLIRNRAERLEQGEALRRRLLVGHVGQGWLDKLATVYRMTELLKHEPGRIPESPLRTSKEDINLSLWHAMADGRTYSTGPRQDGAGALLRHAASVSRYIGDHGAARRYACLAVLKDPRRRESWRLLASSVMGRAGKRLRRALRRGRQPNS